MDHSCSLSSDKGATYKCSVGTSENPKLMFKSIQPVGSAKLFTQEEIFSTKKSKKFLNI